VSCRVAAIRGLVAEVVTAGSRFVTLSVLVAVAVASMTIPADAASPKARPLSLRDMPHGWAVTQLARTAKNQGCLSHFDRPTRHGVVRSVFYKRGKSAELDEVLATGPGEFNRWRKLRHQLSTCHTLTVVNRMENGPSRVALVASPVTFPAVSATSDAYHATMGLTGTGVGFVLAMFRAGTAEGYIIYGSVGPPDTKRATSFVKKAIRAAIPRSR
jgi:hypothetical protein